MAIKKSKLKVKIKLLSEMLGTVPASKEVYKTYLENKKPADIEEDESETVKEREERNWTGFHQDSKGLFVYDYFIKGFLKNAGNVLKDQVSIKNLKSKITDYVFVEPRKIYFGKKKPDGCLERPLRAQTIKGPRVTLVRSDYIDIGTTIEFNISVLEGKDGIDPALVIGLLDYGELQGLGQFRNGGYGRFEVLNVK